MSPITRKELDQRDNTVGSNRRELISLYESEISLQDSKKLPPQNEAYKDDNKYSIELGRWILMPIGAWPSIKSSSSSIERFLRYTIILTCFVLLMCVMIPCGMDVFISDKEVKKRLKSAGPTTFWLTSTLKYYSLVFHGSDIRQCFRHMESDWQVAVRTEDRNLMIRYARIGRYLAGFCAIFMHSGTTSYNILVPITTKIPLDENATDFVNALPYPFYDQLADTKTSPAYEIVYTVQFLSGFIVNTITIGSLTLAVIFVMHACGQLGVLMSWLEDMVDGRSMESRSVQQRMIEIIRHHLRVLSFIGEIEDILNKICLAELIECTLTMCLLGYYSITEWGQIERKNIIAYICLIFSMCFNIFIFCYIGEILTEQCKQVGEKAYMTEWYRLPDKMALDLVLIILMSSSNIKITAGKLIILSLGTFTDVIKTAVAYLNMLRATTL